MNADAIGELLEQLQRGSLSTAVVVERIVAFTSSKSGITADATVDLDRKRRCGFPEVVFGEGKTPQAIVEIFRVLDQHGDDCLATRVSDQQAALLLSQFPRAKHSVLGRTVRLMNSDDNQTTGRVVVVTAGTSDRPVAEEAIETLHWMRCGVEVIVDVGVAGPHRLIEQAHRLKDVDAIVVVAGMEGALPSVVGGHVDCPVIAVPTSVGYGASFKGVAALLGMLNSCASNVTVVNIDAGFKAAYVAGLIARRCSASSKRA